MAEIAICCPHCGRSHKVDDRVAGKRARCKGCGEIFRIPIDQAPIAPSAPLSAAPAGAEGTGYELVDAVAPDGDGLAAGRDHPPPTSGPGPGGSEGTGRQGAPLDSPGAGVGIAKPPRPGRSRADSPGRATASPARTAGLVGVLVLLGWAGWGLAPRAWEAGRALLGQEAAGNPNDPASAGRGGDPDLDLLDIAPDRVELVLRHRKVLEEMAQAYQEMAMGYASLSQPGSRPGGQDEAVRASRKLEEAAGRGAALPRLQAAERVALSEFVNLRLKSAVAGAAQQVARLKQVSGGQGDLDKLLAALLQSQREFDREFPTDFRSPAVLLVMNKKFQDRAQIEIISEKARALADGINSSGWGDEGETSRLKLAPVLSARAYAEKIDFGKVRRVEGRRIELEIQLPTPEEIQQFHARQPVPRS